jgi:MEMO1 family protein
MTRRPAAVAGQFYPGQAADLEKELRHMIPAGGLRRRAFGLMVPHAGYFYSGGCAGKGYARVEIPSRVVILGVNHRGYGPGLAVDGHDQWETPLGPVALDAELRSRLTDGSSRFTVDSNAGLQEHSLEVQVPFLRFLRPDVRILPVTVAEHDVDRLLAAGRELGGLAAGDSDLLLVASTDMSHYIPAERARELDMMALDAVLGLDPAGLLKTVASRRISMCGVAPTAIMLQAAIVAGATRAELVDYTNSGAVSGDLSEVVGYASVLIS